MPTHACNLELQNNGRINRNSKHRTILAEILAIAAFGITAANGALLSPLTHRPTRKVDLGISKHVPLIFTAGPDSGVENLYNVMEGPGPLGVIAEKKKT